jgi:two-component system response regulator (stage 0 sporulation protein F)
MPSILIVDDQKGVRRLLEELFKKDGWQIHIASDGKSAIEMLEEISPDIILMDMKMPNMSGIEASQQILARNPEIQIVIMTAYGEMEVVSQALDIGVCKCITKPFDITYLREVIHQLVERKAAETNKSGGLEGVFSSS